MEKLAGKFGTSLGTAVTKKVSEMTRATPRKNKNNGKGVVLPAFVEGFKGQVLSQAALRNYAKLARRVTNAPLKSEQNFYNLLEALTNQRNSGKNLGRRMGAPTRRLIENVVLPRLVGPPPPPNPMANGFINELRSINFSKTLQHVSPQYAKNLNIIVKRSMNMSNPTRALNLQRENSRSLGVALAHIINDRLGKIHPIEGPGQPSREGAIIGGFFQGLFSQNKNGLTTWASKYFGNRLGNRSLHPELKVILMRFLGSPNTPTSDQQLLQSIMNLYTKMPNSKKYFSSDFLRGLRAFKNAFQHPVVQSAIKTTMNSMKGPASVGQLATTAVLKTLAGMKPVQNAARRTANRVATAAYKAVESVGAKARKREAWPT
jgi:hypothetical protein